MKRFLPSLLLLTGTAAATEPPTGDEAPHCTGIVASSQSVVAGNAVQLEARGRMPDAETGLFMWTTSGGRFRGALSPSATLETDGLAAGAYVVSFQAMDAQNRFSNCSIVIEVRAGQGGTP